MSTDLQPDPDEVIQAEQTDEPAVKVRIEGPVRNQRLPRKAGATFTKTVDTNIVQILRADPHRAKTTLIGGAAFLFAYNEASAQMPATMAVWPSGVPFITEAVTDLWVAAQTGTAALSVATELWATGE